ncbi:hypothetical protein RMN57_23170 [Kitasatospora sp. CM 4170]|uniref:Uncharacterized protein n=1 Tax=Kitasatospora aburaviensis TaxID=67265 RepID=A0ABW1F2R8_9ACTN|nr:hypothetical protein [Kitasatospora sp. CM 4170]WNM47391.1 hypothetical protein RMN57_23170 [Kitasatospora sp. CM 4170]
MADAPAGDGTSTTNGAATPPLDDKPFSLGHGNHGGWFGAVFGVADKMVRSAETNTSAAALVSAFGGKNVQVELDTLTAFTKKVKALLDSMEGSDAAQAKLQEQRLHGDNFGKDFSQSTDVSSAYQRTHNELVSMHQTFVKQIEAMQAAVSKAAANYAGNEEHTTAAHQAVAKNSGFGGSPSGGAGTQAGGL